MSLPSYPEYEDSGIGWLREVPTHWKIVQSRRYFANRNEKARDNDKQLTASQKHGVLYQDAFMELEGQKVVQVILGADILKHVEPNDFVISMRSFQGGIEWCGLRGSISSAYVMLVPKPEIEPRFFSYLLKSKAYIQALQSTTNLVRDGQALRYSNFALVSLPLLPVDEQVAIATFLDRETAKIDGLIAEQEKLISLLAEKRQATISHAVTKGLNPDAPMKDSGVAWLGEVPEHWSIKPLRYCIDFQEGPGIMAADFEESGIPLLRVSGVQNRWASLDGCNYLNAERVANKWHHFRLEEGDLLISASASMGTVCEIGPDTAGSIPYTGLIRLRGKTDEMIKPFVRSLVVSDEFMVQIDLLKAGATIQHFGPTHLSQMIIARPPIDEQEYISAFIEHESARLDELTAEATRGITLLKERRSALISAAVTGKIDVRQLAVAEAA